MIQTLKKNENDDNGIATTKRISMFSRKGRTKMEPQKGEISKDDIRKARQTSIIDSDNLTLNKKEVLFPTKDFKSIYSDDHNDIFKDRSTNSARQNCNFHNESVNKFSAIPHVECFNKEFKKINSSKTETNEAIKRSRDRVGESYKKKVQLEMTL